MSHQPIPGFEIIEKIGQGGMATVWKARQVSLDRVVAIKVLSSRLAKTPDDVKRFQTEAQSAAKLKHQGIAQVYDARAENNVYYYVMEYIAGYTFGDWIRRKGMLLEKDILLATECVADALHYAWQRERIIHCDIKPDNIMIDGDGTIKVADLGLSRTISAMSAKGITNEVMGTPYFISPEQALGHTDIDCRADIYAMGATVYQMATAKMLFFDAPENDVMERQVTAQAIDPLAFNPNLSKPLVALIEKMLMKDREDRHADWSEVIEDVQRVRKGSAPKLRRNHGISTIARTVTDAQLKEAAKFPVNTHPSSLHIHSKATPTHDLPVGLLIFLAVVALAGLLFLIHSCSAGSSSAQRHGLRLSTPKAESDAEQTAKTAYQAAVDWATANPTQYDEIVRRFKNVSSMATDTPYAALAANEARSATQRQRDAADKVMVELAEKVAPLVTNQDFLAAAELYSNYDGALAAETRERRTSAAAELRILQRQSEDQRRRREPQAQAKWKDTLDSIAATLVSQSTIEAARLVHTAITEPLLTERRQDLETLAALLADASAARESILHSFAAESGREITVPVTPPNSNTVVRKTIFLTGVQTDALIGEQRISHQGASASVPMRIPLNDIPLAERLSRISSTNQPAADLAKGSLSNEAGNFELAAKHFALTSPLLASRLATLASRADLNSPNGESRRELLAILSTLNIQTTATDVPSLLNTVRQAALPAEASRTAQTLVEEFRTKYGETSFAKEAEPVLKALAPLGALPAEKTPAAQRAVVPHPQPVALLPREFQEMVGDGNAVLNALLKRNKDLMAESVELKQDGARTIGIKVNSKDLTDITPLAALRDLRTVELECPGKVQGAVKDLSPLAGLPIERLSIRNHRVGDISLARSLPLKSLAIPLTDIKEITALRGLQIEELDLSGTKVFDFAALTGLPLTSLNLADTQLRSIASFKDMPLKRLNIANTRVYDFAVLQDFMLTDLDVSGTQFRDTTLLFRMPLKTLRIANTPVAEIASIAGKPLELLDVSGTLISSFAPIRGMPLTFFEARNSKFSDTQLLAGMPLKHLRLDGSRTEDLSGLTKLPLQSLNIEDCKVTDITPLRRVTLSAFYCRRTRIKDYAPIAGSPIKELTIDDPEGNSWLIRSLPRLLLLNGKNVRDELRKEQPPRNR